MATVRTGDIDKEKELEGYKPVCSLVELQKIGKKKVTLDGRVIALFYVKGKVYALDHFCYRTFAI